MALILYTEDLKTKCIYINNNQTTSWEDEAAISVDTSVPHARWQQGAEGQDPGQPQPVAKESYPLGAACFLGRDFTSHYHMSMAIFY